MKTNTDAELMPSCPCCHSTDAVTVSYFGGMLTCLKCSCRWDESKRRPQSREQGGEKETLDRVMIGVYVLQAIRKWQKDTIFFCKIGDNLMQQLRDDCIAAVSGSTDAKRRLGSMNHDEIESLHTAAETIGTDALTRITPAHPAPNEPASVGAEVLPRYGLQWNGPKEFVSTPMADGYWTPWHMAQELLSRLQSQAGSVPREPTEAMIHAARETHCKLFDVGFVEIWQAMYDAALSAERK